MDPCLDLVGRSGTVHDNGILFLDLYLFCTAQLIHRSIFQLQPQLFADYLSARQDSDILQHFFSSIAETRRFYCNAGKRAAQLIDNQSRQGFAFDILCNNNQFLTRLNDLLQQRQDLLNSRDLFIGNQDVGIVDYRFHLIRICDHVRGNISPVKLHPFNHFAVGLSGFGFFNGDYAIGSHFLHCFANQFAYRLIAGRNSGNTLNISSAGDFLRIGNHCLYSGIDCFLDSLFHDHGGSSRRYVFHALPNQSLGQQGCGSGAVACRIVGFDRNLFYQLRAHVFKRILQLDFLGDGNAVVGDQRRAEFLVQNHIAALGAQRDLDRIGKLIDADLERLSGVFAVNDLFCHS